MPVMGWCIRGVLTDYVGIGRAALARIGAVPDGSFRSRLGGELGPAAWDMWDQHWDALAILLVDRTELRNQIPLLESDADENVSGGQGGKQEMPGGHVRRRPEGE